MFQNKFKERPPSETVEIIRNFFQERGYEIRTEKIEKNEIDCYTTCYTLNLNGQNILHVNGKGVNELFAAASGHAELYERFCNKIPYIRNSHFMNNFMELNKNENGYALHPQEMPITKEEVFSIPSIQEFYTTLIPEENLFSNYCDIFYHNNFIGVPYQSVQNKDIKYIDPRIAVTVSGSTGMSAGNTLYEALNQGISEFFERYCFDLYSRANPSTIYYYLDLDNIKTTEKNKEIIDYLRKKYTLYVFDLSYTYNIPVVLSVLFDQYNMRIHPSFGCFPIFDIALERTLTELYQGVVDYSTSNYGAKYCQQPFLANKYYDSEILYFSNYIGSPIFNENVFNFIEKKETHSSVYLEKDSYTYVDNELIYTYYQQLSNILKFELYYIDNSLDNDMFAVHIFCINKNVLNATLQGLKKEVVDLNNHKLLLDHIFDSNQLFYNLFEGKCNYNSISPIDENFAHFKYNDIYRFLLYSFEEWNLYLVLNNKNTSYSLYKSLFVNAKDFVDIDNYAKESIYYPIVRKYLFLLRYCKQMGVIELQDFCNIVGFSNVTYEDIINIHNKEYWIKQIFTDTINQQFNSDTYKRLLKSFQK